MELLAPPTPRLTVCHNRRIRRLGFAHYDAYIIASTGHAASYVPPTVTLLTGQEKTSFHQRVSRAWKHIGGKIRNHCSRLSTLYSMLHGTLGPLVGPQRTMYPHPLVYKRGAPARRKGAGWVKAKARQRIDSYTTKINTSPSGCRVLRSGGPNHSRSCVFVCLSQC